MKRPAFQFYPGDWQHDVALRTCTLEARGLWIEMMCTMHQGNPYGYLVLNGNPIDSGQLARMVGATAKEVEKGLKQLETAGVFSRDSEGRIFSRRMVKDERIREVRARSGALGGNPQLLNREVNQVVNQDSKQIPTPSFSSASSAIALLAGANPKKRRTTLPEDFEVTDQMAEWAVQRGIQPDRLRSETEKFADHHRAKGSTFIDWIAAWRTWMRNAVEFAKR